MESGRRVGGGKKAKGKRSENGELIELGTGTSNAPRAEAAGGLGSCVWLLASGLRLGFGFEFALAFAVRFSDWDSDSDWDWEFT